LKKSGNTQTTGKMNMEYVSHEEWMEELACEIYREHDDVDAFLEMQAIE
jgi:hypothetical protein